MGDGGDELKKVNVSSEYFYADWGLSFDAEDWSTCEAAGMDRP